ncbi:MAG TPA: arginase family protein, partial [Paracoccaceae bacterium]|nr:arginase family protein [Paracoccaceae bacterium]
MPDRWILTPHYFEQPEPALSAAVLPEARVVNGPHPIADRGRESMARLHAPIARFAQEATSAGERPVSIAGDCCAAVPVLAGLRAAGVEPHLIWIDAHGDFNTPETSPSQFLGGMPLAMIAGRGPRWMSEAVGLAPLPEDRIWLIDGRDLDPLERAALDASAVRRTGIAGLGSLRLDGPVLVHIDMDVLDSDTVPAFQYPVVGGPSVAAVSRACREFAGANRIAGISVCG